MRAALRRAAPPLAAVAVLALPAGARAEWGGSVAVESDARFRGISLTDERPAARVTLGYDHASGGYAGASLGNVAFEGRGRYPALLGYAGITGAAAAGWRWDAGATYWHVAGMSRYDYAEAYAGVLGERWSARLFVSPDYYGGGARTAYVELDAGWPFAAGWRVAAHVGVLRRIDVGGAGARTDGRVSAAVQVGAVELQFAWVGVTTGGPYVASYDQRRSTLVASAAFAF